MKEQGLIIRFFRKFLIGNHFGGIRSFNKSTEAFKQYVNFHTSVVRKLIDLGDNTLIIDCHSFSTLPKIKNTNPRDVDICIGYNDDESRPDKVVIGNIVQYFKTKGYNVGINEPFSNSKTFSTPTKYHSIMIKVKKSIYMNEYTLKKTENFMKIKHDIQALYGFLIQV